MISIIIPTYNNQDTIVRALTSVTCQTYHDWQIVVVNDSSTDNTLKIINNQFKQYYKDKIKIINNKENSGVGISRKIGVDNADGEFVIFLDSDDYLLPNCLEMSIMLQEQHNSDIVYSNTTIYVDDEHVKNLDVPDCIMEGKISPTLHANYAKKWLTGKMFRTSLMKTVPMSPKRIGEDVNTLFYACYLANKVRSSSYSGYIHVYRPDSLIGIGDDKPFYYYCESCLVDIEIFDFLISKNDNEALAACSKIPYFNWLYHKLQIDEGKITQKEVNENIILWKRICKWFEDNEELLKKMHE